MSSTVHKLPYRPQPRTELERIYDQLNSWCSQYDDEDAEAARDALQDAVAAERARHRG